MSLVAVTGCDGSGNLPPRWSVPVACDRLADADAPPHDGRALTDQDVSPGEVRLVLRWIESGQERWHEPVRTDAHIGYRPYEPGPNPWGPDWHLWVPLPCVPPAAAFIHFAPDDLAPDPLGPGDYAFTAFAFDVPAREQGWDPDHHEVSGVVTVTAAAAGRASGFLNGTGRVALRSHYSGELLGIEVEVVGMAFRDVPAAWVSGDEG